jgi:hypothetical protein
MLPILVERVLPWELSSKIGNLRGLEALVYIYLERDEIAIAHGSQSLETVARATVFTAPRSCL